MERGNEQFAKEQYKGAMEIAPGNALYYNSRGDAHFEL